MLEIKKRLGKQLPVIEYSEFRTSKLCLDYGRVAKFYNYGVTSCQERTPTNAWPTVMSWRHKRLERATWQ